MKCFKIACLVAFAICLAFSAFAQGLPPVSKPEEVGFSSERLSRIRTAFQADVDKGVIPGAVILIARRHKVAYFDAVGFQSPPWSRNSSRTGKGSLC
jgi:CubicO group peptidase (beta-lactamase class C family)